jgi:hypothetical protein
MATKMPSYDQAPNGSANNWFPGSGSLIQDYGSADPDPKDLFTDPQHWSAVSTKICILTNIYGVFLDPPAG